VTKFSLKPEACFDCLSVGCRLQDSLSNFRISEVHLFCYLSCLLSLYKKWPLSDWQYQFAGTKEGSPFSEDIADAIERLVTCGYIIRDRAVLTITKEGQIEYNALLEVSSNKQRDVFIEAACSSILTLPIGVIRTALCNEPELKSALLRTGTKRLLDGPGLNTLYDQFAALSNVIGVEVNDLLVPSTVWINYLLNTVSAHD
jgi:hypothetical protein